MPEPVACKNPPEADRAQLYEILVSHLTDFVVFLTDPEGCIVSWNPAVERILGYSESEWLGQSIDILFTREDRALGKHREEIANAAKHGEFPDIRWHVRRDGSRLFIEGTLVALRDPTGKLLGFSKVVRDVTERKRRELQLEDALAYAESIVDTVREPLLVLDSELRVRSANRSFYRAFRTSRHETENQRLYELGNGHWDLPALRTLLEELVPEQTAVENFEVEHEFPDLGRKVMLLNARRLWREGNHTGLTLLAIEDITERKQAEKALAQTESQRRLIMDAAPAMISYVDRNLRYRLVNSTYQRWFGVTPADMIGKSVTELFGSSFVNTIQHHLEKVLEGESVTFEDEFPVPDGCRTLQVTYTPDQDETGEVQGFVVLGSDISARKKSEQALRESEERWRSLFERMAEGFFVGEIIDDTTGRPYDFRFKEVNPAFERLTGLINPSGRTVREVIPGVQDDLIHSYARVISTGECANFEIHIPELQNRWYEVRARRTDPRCFAVLFLDITERKAAEARLRNSERHQAALVALGDRLRDLKDISSITAAAMEIVGTTLGVARAGYGTVDQTQEHVIIGRDWTNGTVASLAGTYRFRDFGKELGSRLQHGEFITIRDVASDPISAEESERWKALDIRAVLNVPLVEEGRLKALLFIQDVAPRAWTDAELTFVRKVADRAWASAERARALQELQKSEEFTRSILASSPDCVKVIDLEGRLLTMNEGGCRQMEIENLAFFLNQPWTNFWLKEKHLAEQAIAQAREGHSSRFEGFCPTAKGTPKWWEVVVTPIQDASGKPVRILSLSRDITERQLAERERERLTQELKRSNEELSHFAHIAAHDLQAPLRGVVSFAQLLERKAQTRLFAEDKEFLDQIIESAHRMQELVQALLRFAQVGQGEVERRPIAMEDLVDAAFQTLQMQIRERRATVSRGPLPAVKADAVQLEQLLQNLIGNALKYSRLGVAPEISITATEEGSHIVFAVADNGEGIASEHLHRVFEPLKRLHGADVPGTGLGLATCQRIVSRHGGRIWVESQPGVGSTFYFTLPNL